MEGSSKNGKPEFRPSIFRLMQEDVPLQTRLRMMSGVATSTSAFCARWRSACSLHPFAPIAWIAVLMSHSVHLRSCQGVFAIDDRVRKAFERVDPHVVFTGRTQFLIGSDQLDDSFELVQVSHCNGTTRFFCVVHRRIAKLDLGFRVNPVVQAILARTRASASSP